MARSEAEKPTDGSTGHGSAASRWLNRTVLGIGLASLFSDVGHEMATTAMPALLAALGSSSLLLGVIEGVSDGASSFAKLYSGLYSDRLRRRKPLAVIGYFLTASGMASFALATRGWHVLLGRVVGWLGRGARSPVRNVLLTEATTKETYGRAFGLERAMDSAGAVVGPLIAVGVVAHAGVRSVFGYTFIPGILAALLVATLVQERPHEPQPHAQLSTGIRALPTGFRRFLVGVGIAGLGDFSKTLLILWATQAWTAAYGYTRAAALAMSFYVGYNVVYTVSCYLAGVFADRLPKNRVLAGGYALAAIPAVALVFPGASIAKFAIVFGVSGLYMGVWETVESSSAAVFLPSEVRGVGFGALATVNGIGDLLSSVVVGALWAYSPIAAMSTVVVTSVVGALIIGSSKSDLPAPEGEGREETKPLPALSVYGSTHVGRVRDSNEDAFVVYDVDKGASPASAEVSQLSATGPGVLLMVCDGMGGAAAGEVAAGLAAETTCRTLFENRANPDLVAALEAANLAIYKESRRETEERGMGTTATAALIRDGELLIAQVGDSRAYLFRDNDLERLTRDQSLAVAMMESGALSPAELDDFPHGNVILQALGVAESVVPVVTKRALKPDDTLLVCSDGLHGYVDDERIRSALRSSDQLPARALALIQAALDVGAPDNVTVVLARWDG
ncbi:MAG TPA: MFS transporter [Polyangia bacterium]|nr:MFS transporter [Polyangia bacterium]